MGDSVMRIEGYMPGHSSGGGGAVFVAPRQNRAQRFQWLFAAIDAADLEGAQHALTALLNFDANLAHDADFTKISRALHDKQMYAAQHFAHEYQAKLVHQLDSLSARPVQHVPMPGGGDQSHVHLAHASTGVIHQGEDGLPHVDTMA